ncbi:MAG: porin [Ferruginibacter sp.]
MKKILLAAMILASIKTSAQIDTTVVTTTNTNPLTFSGYAEGYYSYDFNKPENNTKPGFLYGHNRHNEFNVNLAFVRGTYNGDKVRGTVAIGVGTYMNANYAAEAGTLKNIYEANAGFKLGRKNLWIDIGVLPSHIGFESAVSKDCPTLIRSLLAENTPFFEGGVRLNYTSDNGKWLLSGLAVNGWQRITRVEGNSLMSFGTQVQYKPSAATTLNYSTFIGTDKPDSARLIRVYHNVYGIFQVTKKFGLTGGVDIGTEQKTKGSSDHNTVYLPVLIAKYSINDKWAIAARGEYYSDKNGILISTGTPDGFKTTGFSLNLDYAPAGNVLVRLEGRSLNSKDPIFTTGNSNSRNDTYLTSSIAISF